MPPIRGASGWMMSTERCSIRLEVLGDAGQHLAGGDRGVERGGELGVTFGVVRVERLLDPDQVELLEGAADPHGGRPVPLLVGVDHERHVVAEVLADGGDPGQVDPAVGLTDLDLDAADAVGQGLAGPLLDLLDRGVQEAARGVVGRHRVAVRAEELGQRQVGPLGLEVVEGDVEGRDGLGGHAAAADRGAGPEQLLVDPADVVGVLAEQAVGDLLGVGVLGGSAGSLGVAEAESLVAVLGA